MKQILGWISIIILTAIGLFNLFSLLFCIWAGNVKAILLAAFALSLYLFLAPPMIKRIFNNIN